MKDYTGKTLYLGIDVHKATYAITAICEKTVVKRATLTADPEVLVAFCKKYFRGAAIKSAYEAGFSGFHLHRILQKNEIENVVVHPAGIEVAAGNKVKTDKKDSLKIATQLEAGRLKGIHVPSEEREEKRALTRLRDIVVSNRVCTGNQIKALLHQHGLIPPKDNKKICPKWIKNLEKLSIRDGIRLALNHLVEIWQQATTKVQEIDMQLDAQAAEDAPLEAIYRSTPGIGRLSARILANEMGDMSHFNNERELFSCTGLTPSEHSSGEHIRKGHISRQGKTVIRRVLVLAAWKAIKLNLSLEKTFERIAKTAGKKKAIVAIARRLIGHIRACFKKDCLYRTAAIPLTSIAA